MSKCELEVNGTFSFTCDDGCGIVCDATPTAAPGGGVIKCLCLCGNEPPTVCLAEEPTGGNQPTVASVAASIAASTQVAIALNEVRLQQAAAWLNYVSPRATPALLKHWVSPNALNPERLQTLWREESHSPLTFATISRPTSMRKPQN